LREVVRLDRQLHAGIRYVPCRIRTQDIAVYCEWVLDSV